MTTMYGVERDSQRSKLYKAERTAWFNHPELFGPGPSDFWRTKKADMTLGEVEDFIMELHLSFQHSAELLVNARLDLKDGRGARSARGGFSKYGGITTIVAPLWARNRAVMVHEFAHVLHHARAPEKTEAPHGWQFAAIYLEVIDWVFGKRAREVMETQFKIQKVRYKPKRKRKPMTPEQRERAAENLKRARLAKEAKSLGMTLEEWEGFIEAGKVTILTFAHRGGK